MSKQEPTREQKNKELAEYLFGDKKDWCWHETEAVYCHITQHERCEVTRCKVCYKTEHSAVIKNSRLNNPDFYDPDAPRSLVEDLEKKVIEVFGVEEYNKAFDKLDGVKFPLLPSIEVECMRFFTVHLSTPQRSDACWELIKEKDE